MSNATATPEETIWHGDGREKVLHSYLLTHPNLSTLRNNPEAILAEIDRWGVANGHTMMTIGLDRSQPIIDIIRESRPQTMAELGGYIGYSAILFGNEVRRGGGKRFISFEYNREYAAIAKWLIDLAGLGDFVQIIVGSSADSLLEVAKDPASRALFDVLFIDHWEEAYLSDLRICETNGLVKSGSVVVADNAGNETAQDYVRWVEEGGRYDSRRVPCVLPNGHDDVVLISRMV